MTTTIYKQLAAQQDMLLGLGTVVQSRNGVDVTVNKVNVDFRFNTLAQILASVIPDGLHVQLTERGDAVYLISPIGTSVGLGDILLTSTQVAVLVVQGVANVQWFGAKADYDTTKTNNREAFNDCQTYCRTKVKAMYIPSGKYSILSALDIGGPIDIYGDGQFSSFLYPEFSTPTYLFNFNSSDSCHIHDFGVIGPAQYDVNTMFLSANPAYLMQITNIRLQQLGGGIWMYDSWGSYIDKVRIMTTTNPIYSRRANGGSISNVYIISYKGSGIFLDEGLSVSLKSIIIEHGDTGGETGIQLKATQNASIDGLYTEGTMLADIFLTQKNQRACVNTLIRNCWFNSSATRIIAAASFRGLTIEDITMQTPAASHLIDFTGIIYWSGPIYVGSVCQVDQNAAGGIGDVRDTGQTLIPISSGNTLIELIKRHPSVGDYTDADLTNIANYTVKDAGGDYCHVPEMAKIAGYESAFDTGYAGIVQQSMGLIALSAEEPTTSNIKYFFSVIESVGPCDYYIEIKNLTNATTKTQLITGGTTSLGNLSGNIGALPMEKGDNQLQVLITRTSNDGGTTTISNSKLVVGKNF